MSRTGRNSILLFLVALIVATLSMSVLAASEGEEGQAPEDGGSTTTTIATGLEPAVPVIEGEATPAAVDWTYRYLIPTGIGLAVLIVVVTAVKYFTDVVRKRYRIVKE